MRELSTFWVGFFSENVSAKTLKPQTFEINTDHHATVQYSAVELLILGCMWMPLETNHLPHNNLQIKRTPPKAPTHTDDVCSHTTEIAPKEPEECDKMLKVST